jgi:AmmeMemoRadiSam system protein A
VSIEAAMQVPPQNAGIVLVSLARAAIAQQIGRPLSSPEQVDWLRQPGACFITLTCQERLRGCIGTLQAHRALGEDVQQNAVAAAFRDPRFKPLTLAEFDGVEVEVSLLSPLEPLQFADEYDALKQLRVGMDGVVFQYGHHKSTFLPQVWRDFTEAADFMAHLKYKAGLPPDFWDPEVKLSRYTVAKWRESELRMLKT